MRGLRKTEELLDRPSMSLGQPDIVFPFEEYRNFKIIDHSKTIARPLIVIILPTLQFVELLPCFQHLLPPILLISNSQLNILCTMLLFLLAMDRLS